MNEEGKYYRLNGTKIIITNGSIADLVLVFTRMKLENGQYVINCVIVEKDTPGFSRSKMIHKMGLRTSPFCELIFENCLIPKNNLLGKLGIGKNIFQHSMVGERAFILAAQIDAMERQLEETVAHANIRRQFGKRIREFQAVSHMLADMKVRLETSCLLAYKVAWLKDQDKNGIEFSSIAKLYISEASVRNSLQAMRVFGGYGYTREYEQERLLRDSIGGLFFQVLQ